MKKIVGVDIGGTSIKLGLFSLQGEKIGETCYPTPVGAPPEVFFQQLAQEVDQLLLRFGSKEELLGVGLGVPGPVRDQRFVSNVVNLGWRDVDIVDVLSRFIHCPILVENDANVAALGEFWQGAGFQVDSLVFITLGTGVGGGVILNRKLFTGSTGAGGEIGHMPFLEEEAPEACNCGGRWCLELVASATGITRRTKRLLQESPQSSALRSYKHLDARLIFDQARQRDALAQRIVDQTGRYLGRALAILSAILDPQKFIIGGGVCAAGALLLDPVVAYYQQYAFPGLRSIPIVQASLGNDAGMYGAARLLLED